MSNILMNTELQTKPGRKRKTKDSDKCLVCGGFAIGINFGVQTCSPCKAFFRRNAVKLGKIEFQCRGDGNCPVTGDTRRQCNCCRLAKCFQVGMNRQAILTDNQREERNRIVELNRQKRAEKKQTQGKALIRPSGLSLYSETHSLSLSHNDYNLLSNIFHAYQRTCITYTYEQHLSMPVNETLTLQKFMNASVNMYKGVICYIKSMPEFFALPIDTKMSLIKNNIKQVIRKHSAYSIKNITPELDHDWPVVLHIFPEDLYTEMRATGIALSPFLNDPILIKLFIIILMLTTYTNIQYEDCSSENDSEAISRQILAAQNIYVELLWRYIISRCSSYRKSVQFLTLLIARTLKSQILQVNINQFINTCISNKKQPLDPIMKSLWTS